jgi:transposase
MMDEQVRWTNLTLGKIVAALREDHQIQISQWVVRKLLKKHGYRRRKAQKKTTMKDEIKHRDAQFEKITQRKAADQAAGKSDRQHGYQEERKSCRFLP